MTSAQVYVLAGATPTLYAYPSQVHPAPPAPTGGIPVHGRRYDPPLITYEPTYDHESALAVLGVI